MKQNFIKPVCENISFGHDVITSSLCPCDVGGLPFPSGDENICTQGDGTCTCSINYNPAEANCIPCPGAYNG